MTTATVSTNDEALELREFKPREPLFTEEQQKRFDRAFGKREAKLRAEYEQKIARMTIDLLDAADLLRQLLPICQGRIDPQTAAQIQRGVNDIQLEYVRKNARTN